MAAPKPPGQAMNDLAQVIIDAWFGKLTLKDRAVNFLRQSLYLVLETLKMACVVIILAMLAGLGISVFILTLRVMGVLA